MKKHTRDVTLLTNTYQDMVCYGCYLEWNSKRLKNCETCLGKLVMPIPMTELR
jgi:hypothetical protein